MNQFSGLQWSHRTPPREQADRQTRLKTLPSRNFVGGWQFLIRGNHASYGIGQVVNYCSTVVLKPVLLYY